MTPQNVLQIGDEAPLHLIAQDSFNRCLACGRKLGITNRSYFTVNTAWILVDPYQKEGTQGSFPVGPECAKMFDPAIMTKVGA
jgi:hypothetical protein